MRRTSAQAKSAILAAARDRFASDGYDRATIRSIAADAAIDPAMVMRYFGSKEQLFATAAEFDLELPDLRETPYSHVGARLVEHFLDRWEDDDQALRILLRASVTRDAIAERMRQIFAGQLAPRIAAISGESTAQLRAGLVSTQLLGVALCRYVLRIPPVTGMSRAEIAEWVGPTLQRYLAANPEDHLPVTAT